MTLTFANFIPLIGTFGIAGEQYFGRKPEYSASYASSFLGNEQYYNNYSGVEYIDLGESNWDLEQSEINVPYVDVVLGVPPCSSLSTSNPNAGFKKGSGCHMYNAINYVLGKMKPKVFIFENAPVLASKTSEKGINTRKEFKQMSEGHGYNVTYLTTNTLDHGLPQRRLRSYAVMYEPGFLDVEANNIVRIQATKDYTPLKQFLAKVTNTDAQIAQAQKSAFSAVEVAEVVSKYTGINVFNYNHPTNIGLFRILRDSQANTDGLPQAILKYAEENERFNTQGRIHATWRQAAKDVVGNRGFGYAKPIIMGHDYTNVLFQQSLPCIITPERRHLTQPEVAALTGLPAEFGQMEIAEWQRVITQSCPVTTNKAVLAHLFN